ncbi:MAG: glycosyltransferase family 2 protein [Candidatus Heimdallarchaeaceae archaeon]
MKNRITIHICTRDRHSELFGLLLSLKYQTIQNFDILICDDASGNPIINCYFITLLINRMKLEGHRFKIIRNPNSFGCCYARNRCIEEDDFGNELTMRLDDDVILEPDYIEKLLVVINKGYDMASGVVPNFGVPEMKRKNKFIKPIINKKEFDKNGNIIKYADDCGFCYLEDEIIQTDEFRTNCLYKSEINKKIKYEPNLSHVAFREEAFFSTRAILEGYSIAVRTGAIAWHLQCPSGGNRCSDYNEKVKIDNETYYKWMKKMYQKHGNFLKVYHNKFKRRLHES